MIEQSGILVYIVRQNLIVVIRFIVPNPRSFELRDYMRTHAT